MAATVRVTIILDKDTYLRFKRMADRYHCSVPALIKMMLKTSWNHFIWIMQDAGFTTLEDFWLWKV